MPIPLGILAAAGVRAAGGSYELIETITVGSGGAASVTFSNLNTYSSTYQHLQIRLTARNTFSGSDRGSIYMRFNGDSAANYRGHSLYANGSSVSSFVNGTNQIDILDFPYVSTAGNEYAAAVIDILDPYETAKNTTVRALGGPANSRMSLSSGAWFNTTAISSIVFSPISPWNFYQGSRFSIYGLKAS